MSMVTLKQIAKTINLIAESGIESTGYQRLLESGRFTELLREFTEERELEKWLSQQSQDPDVTAELVDIEPTITPVTFARNYDLTLVQARDGMGLDAYVEQEINDTNFPPEGRDGDREFVLVCFNRDIDDHEDPEKSELLKELGKLNLEPEGPMELCFLGVDEQTRKLQRQFPIVARRQTWKRQECIPRCPVLFGYTGLFHKEVRIRWSDDYRFLASRK